MTMPAAIFSRQRLYLSINPLTCSLLKPSLSPISLLVYPCSFNFNISVSCCCMCLYSLGIKIPSYGFSNYTIGGYFCHCPFLLVRFRKAGFSFLKRDLSIMINLVLFCYLLVICVTVSPSLERMIVPSLSVRRTLILYFSSSSSVCACGCPYSFAVWQEMIA